MYFDHNRLSPVLQVLLDLSQCLLPSFPTLHVLKNKTKQNPKSPEFCLFMCGCMVMLRSKQPKGEVTPKKTISLPAPINCRRSKETTFKYQEGQDVPRQEADRTEKHRSHIKCQTRYRELVTNNVEAVEETDPSLTVGGRAGWCSHCGHQCGGFSRN